MLKLRDQITKHSTWFQPRGDNGLLPDFPTVETVVCVEIGLKTKIPNLNNKAEIWNFKI